MPKPHKISLAAVCEALVRANYNKKLAAKLLGISRPTLYRYLKLLKSEHP